MAVNADGGCPCLPLDFPVLEEIQTGGMSHRRIIKTLLSQFRDGHEDLAPLLPVEDHLKCSMVNDPVIQSMVDSDLEAADLDFAGEGKRILQNKFGGWHDGTKGNGRAGFGDLGANEDPP